jgi:hypothetical protein
MSVPLIFAIAFPCLIAGASIGFVLASMHYAGAREDICRACRMATLSDAFREVDSFGGTDD